MAEKTEEPTEKKLKDARLQGQVGQSQDVPKLLIFAAVIELTLLSAEEGMERLKALASLAFFLLDEPFAVSLPQMMTRAGMELLLMLLPVLGLAIVMRLLGGWIQFGPMFAPKALTPQFERLNPVNQFKQMFSGQALLNLLSSLCKAILLCGLLYLLLPPKLEELINLAHIDIHQIWLSLIDIFSLLSRIFMCALLVLAVVDFAIQKYFFIKGQRMSHEDIRKEYKEMEGDPYIKSHRQAQAREFSMQSPSSSATLPMMDTDMLLVNPTHFAVGLFYKPQITPLPRIVCKGHDAQARALIERAQQAGIPVIRYVWLARTLYQSETGRYIPRETLQAVAQVYRLLRELDEHAAETIIDMPELPR